MARRNQEFQTIHSEGGLLPPDLLRQIMNSRTGIPGTRPEDYGLPKGERLNETITQSWNRLQKHWQEFRDEAPRLTEGTTGTGLTNEKLNLPLLRELGFGMLPTTAAPEINGRSYAINRFFGAAAIHLIGCRLSLDRRMAGARGAASQNPHGLIQEFLNRDEKHLWAILSNGLQLRILRDNAALSRQAYLEFDLETIFDSEVYSDFVLLWLLAHATRFNISADQRPDQCRIETWTQIAGEQGTRALESLRGGVEKALQVLGQGFVGHPRNAVLREHLRAGELTLTDFHAQLLRVVYRLIFLFVAEDRLLDGIPVLHPRSKDQDEHEGRQRYQQYYSAGRLRDLAGSIRGSRHGDLWQQFNLVVDALSGAESSKPMREVLNLPALGSFLWSPDSTANLNASMKPGKPGCELSNADFLETIRHLAFFQTDKVLRSVNYRNLGAEELGGVYESQLALTPQLSGGGQCFSFAEVAGSERKLSGSYYTPDSLVQSLLESALDPVVDAAIAGKRGREAEEALLALKVCDPAVGSGHFLVGAAHRLARQLARIRALAEDESEPSPRLYQSALRDVIGHCLYGVDVNPMSAELCKVSLWLEALEPGKPLSFLDHHIQVGNSLLGATPELMEAGIPDEAFNPLVGDEKKISALFKKRNREERKHQGRQEVLALDRVAEPEDEFNSILARARALDDLADGTLEEVEIKSDRLRALQDAAAYRHSRLVADAWCAAFMWPLASGSEPAITETVFRKLMLDPQFGGQGLRREICRLAGEYGFFHWHLAFPEVQARGGFDCVLGNPPWEHTELKEKEWFAERCPEIAETRTGAERKAKILALEESDPESWDDYQRGKRIHDGISQLLAKSGHFPFCGRGRINLYAVFAELMRNLLNSTGQAGCILPTGIATDDTTKFFFQDVVRSRSLVSLYDFENKGIFFPNVHSSYKFCLFNAGSGRQGSPPPGEAEFVFFAHAVEELKEPERRFRLTPEDLALLNPNTLTCPIFRSRKDAVLTKAIYRRVPVLIREARDDQPEENPWGVTFKQGLFNMTSDSHLFRTREQLEAEGWQLEGNIFQRGTERYLPLYEAKMIHHFDHRWATYDGLDTRDVTLAEKQDPNFVVMGRYWVPEQEVTAALASTGWQHDWLLGWRDITNTTNERTVLGGVFPLAGVGNNLPIWTTSHDGWPVFSAILSSFACDFIARFKVGGTHLNFFIAEQLSVLPPTILDRTLPWGLDNYSLASWFILRVVELTCVGFDQELMGQEVNWFGPPFRWDEERRFLIRCELDAAFFHLYLPSDAQGTWRPARKADGCPCDETSDQLAELQNHFPTPRHAVDYILDTFPIVRRKDEEAHGEYRTKRVILEIYDAMQEAIRTGTPYQTRLDPLPGPPETPLPEWKSGQARPEGWPVHIHPPRGVRDGH